MVPLFRVIERRDPIVGSPFSGEGLYLISAQSSGGQAKRVQSDHETAAIRIRMRAEAGTL